MDSETIEVPACSKMVLKKPRKSKVPASAAAFRRRMVEAWDMYCDGASVAQVSKHLDISDETFRLRYQKPQKWSEVRERFRAGESVDPPWLAFPDAKKIQQKRRSLEGQTPDQKQKRQKAFALYCTGHKLGQIAEDLDVPVNTLACWQHYGKWRRAKELVASGENVKLTEDLPDEVLDMVSATQAIIGIYKHTAAQVVTEAIQHVQENWQPDDVLDRINDIKSATQTMDILEGKKQEQSSNVNIMIPIQAVKDQGAFDVELEDV
jgi:transposase